MTDQNHRRAVPKRIADIHDRWTKQARYLRVVHVFLVVIATATSVLAATGLGKTISSRLLPGGGDLLAAMAAVSIGFVSAFDLGGKSNDFRNAWRLLHAAIIRFEEEPDYTVEKLIEAYEQAEKMIGDVNTKQKP